MPSSRGDVGHVGPTDIYNRTSPPSHSPKGIIPHILFLVGGGVGGIYISKCDCSSMAAQKYFGTAHLVMFCPKKHTHPQVKFGVRNFSQCIPLPYFNTE